MKNRNLGLIASAVDSALEEHEARMLRDVEFYETRYRQVVYDRRNLYANGERPGRLPYLTAQQVPYQIRKIKKVEYVYEYSWNHYAGTSSKKLIQTNSL